MKRVMGWQPEQLDNRIAMTFGAIGGIWQFFLNAHLQVDAGSKILEAVITGLLAGFAGMVGKELFKIVMRHVIRPLVAYYKTRKSK